MTAAMTGPILVTGFEPFDGEALNPSAQVVAQLAAKPPRGVDLATLVLPVERGVADARLIERVERSRPEAVLMLGEAGGRACITPERIAINVDDYRIADNAGAQPRGEAVVPGAPAGYFSSLPIAQMVTRLEQAGIPARISNSAGTYLCNRVFFRLVHHVESQRLPVRAGFVHLPYLHEQVVGKAHDTPSMSLDTLVRGVRLMLEVLRDVRSGPR